MHAVDVNVLMYARFDFSRSHRLAYDLLTDLRSIPTGLALFPSVVNGFLRLATDGRVISEPLPPMEAFGYLDELLLSPTVRMADPGGTYWSLFRGMVDRYSPTASEITDVSLAAAAIEIDATWVSFDRGFSRFSELDWIDPRTD